MESLTIPEFEFSRQARRSGTERALVRRARAGELTRIRAGVYVPTPQWNALSKDAKYRARVLAAATVVRHGTQFGFDSAAVMWGLPSLGPWSPDIHVMGLPSTGGRSSSGIRRHGSGLDLAPATIAGVTVTSLERTIIDVGRVSSFARTVCMADRVVLASEQRGTLGDSHAARAKSAVLELISSMTPSPGLVKAQRAIEFADPLSGSVGESLSRAQIHLLGFPPPQLQVAFYDSDGLIGYVDFYWPELGLIGEFDGKVKYGNEVYLRGRLPEHVLWAEKQRENRLRAVAPRFVRWDWDLAMDAQRLGERLRSHGLHPIA